VRLTFENGDLARADAEDRPRLVGGRTIPTRWAARCFDYREIDGCRIPTRAVVRWFLESGPFDYFRGRCVMTDDLVAALRSGHLAGAGLDVADPEPLPPDHPLWSMPNVLITPHVAFYGTPYRDKWEAMLIENCRRFAAGQPLLNIVDKEKRF
jgi:hypothetical protein